MKSTPLQPGISDQDVSVREAEHLWGGEPGEDKDMIGTEKVSRFPPLIGDVIQAAERDCVLPVVLRLPLVAPSTDATTSRRVGSAAWPTSSRGVAHRRLGPQA